MRSAPERDLIFHSRGFAPYKARNGPKHGKIEASDADDAERGTKVACDWGGNLIP
jgi:hypothetical protein